MGNLRALRRKKGLTQAALAEQAGASQTRISAHELGKRPLTMRQLLAIAVLPGRPALIICWTARMRKNRTLSACDGTRREPAAASGNGRHLTQIRAWKCASRIDHSASRAKYETGGEALPTAQNSRHSGRLSSASAPTSCSTARTWKTPYPPKTAMNGRAA